MLARVARSLTPPILWPVFRRAAAALGKLVVQGEERDAAWYDRIYKGSVEYAKHYTASIYYPSWFFASQTIVGWGAKSILDIGCGPGQFAECLSDQANQIRYTGLDFSGTAIEAARKRCPEHDFIVADVVNSAVLEDAGEYDTVVCTEFLEHVEKDRDVIARLRKGVSFFGSVPNFDSAGHVRYFTAGDEVEERYGEFFDRLTVVPCQMSDHGTTLFLMLGQTAS